MFNPFDPTPSFIHDRPVQLKPWQRRPLNQAIEVRRFGVSHRPVPMKVGCCCVATRSPTWWPLNRQTFTGHNYKPHETGGERICAEAMARNEARKSGFTRIPVLYVAAPNQVDDSSGVQRPVLLPCGYCRTDFNDDIENGGLICADTWLVSYNIQTGAAMSFRIGKLLEDMGVPGLRWMPGQQTPDE